MRMYDIINDKKNGKELTNEQLKYFIEGVTDGTIPDYQTSALLMAIFLRGLNEKETFILTDCMARSGEMIDLSSIPGIKADKHSTGGVGDKTTLIVAPIVASCGVSVAKMSGRGLGHTGGTIDKLESIPGFVTSLSREEFLQTVRSVGCSVISQTGNIAPADKKLYALRDVTATVDNISLIASSVMSKKIASGGDVILLDVKFGSGAFMKTSNGAIELARMMTRIGEHFGRKTAALITNMDVPLGYAIGNSLEIAEVIDTLKNRGPSDLREICVELSANMLELAGNGNHKACRIMAETALADGSALRKFADMVRLQHGDASVVEDVSKLKKAPYSSEIYAQSSGFVISMDTEKCGTSSVLLGAGRKTKEDKIDYSAGVILKKKYGDDVKKGEVLATLYTSDKAALEAAQSELLSAYAIGNSRPVPEKLIYAKVTSTDIETF